MYAIGGHDGWSYLNTVERWDPQARQWSYVAPMSTARSTVGVAVLGNKYVVLVTSFEMKKKIMIIIIVNQNYSWMNLICVFAFWQTVCSGRSRWQLLPALSGVFWSPHQQVVAVCPHDQKTRRRWCGNLQWIPLCCWWPWCSSQQPHIKQIWLRGEVGLKARVRNGAVRVSWARSLWSGCTDVALQVWSEDGHMDPGGPNLYSTRCCRRVSTGGQAVCRRWIWRTAVPTWGRVLWRTDQWVDQSELKWRICM